LAKRSA